jgi:peptidoglycan/LPS O-acetylase OafA/YrhL
MTYRPALDGIRAVAVLAVIAYHVSGHLPGGFLGVDAFFVLSGYLITSLLLDGFGKRGLGSLADFWTRRGRRLLPALLIVVAACAVVTGANDPAQSFAARRADMISTLFYYANWHFIAVDQSYFAMFTGASPLRHVWSLAIEEQFYLVWPLLLFGALRVTRGRNVPLLVLIFAGTVVSAVDMALRFDAANPSPAYYATDARAQQLLIGAGLAVLLAARGKPPGGLIERFAARWWPLVVAALAGLVLFTHADASWYFRGGAALFALVVALLLLIVELHPDSIPAALLSLRPVRWVGKISYGLYLWHWPIIVWLADPSIALAPRAKQVLEVAATFVLATASFYVVERPIRYGKVPWIRVSRVRFAAAISVCVLIVAEVAVRPTTIGSPALALAIADASDAPCPQGSPLAGGFVWCVRAAGAGPNAPVVATAGDSTARALDPGLRALAMARGWRYVQVAQNGCSFLALLFPPSRDSKGLAQARGCESGIPKLIADVLGRASPRLWIYSDRWPEVEMLRADGTYLGPLDSRRERPIALALADTLRRLTSRGAQIVLIGQPPPGEPADCALHRTIVCGSPAFSTRDPVTAEVDKIYQRVAATMPGRVVYGTVSDLLCPGSGSCPAEVGGQLARFDGVHYTAAFSRRIVPVIIARAERLGLSLG